MPPSQNARLLKPLIHLIYFLSGIGTVLIGQVLPVFARHFNLNDLQASWFFPSQFAGSLCGTVLTNRFARRGKIITATAIGGVLMALGLLLMNADLFPVCLAGFFVNGLGIGMTLPPINMMILEMNAERSASALSILNFCWGVGAIISKPFVDFFSTPDNIGWTTIILASPLFASSILTAAFARSETNAPAKTADIADEPISIWRMPVAWAIALFNFIHVGFESGMGGWLTTYTGRVEGETLFHWLSPTLLYFAFFVVGRGVAPVLFRYLNENKMLFLGLAITFAGMAFTLSAHTVIALSLGSTIAGFGTSWIFPTNVSRFSRVFGPSATRRATPLFMCGTLGAASVTWLIGFLSNQTGDLRYGMYVLGISIVLLLVLQVGLAQRQTVFTHLRSSERK